MSQTRITSFFAPRGKVPPAPKVVRRALPKNLWKIVLEYAPCEDLLWLEHRIKYMLDPEVICNCVETIRPRTFSKNDMGYRTLLTLHHGSLSHKIEIEYHTSLHRVMSGVKPSVFITTPLRLGKRAIFEVKDCAYEAALKLIDLYRTLHAHTGAFCLRPAHFPGQRKDPRQKFVTAKFHAPPPVEVLAALPYSLLEKGDH